MPDGSVDEQAVTLAEAVAASGQSALAPLLAAYGAAGLPVIDADGESVSGTGEEDPLGPPWWLVWSSAGSNPTIHMSLADTAKLANATPDAFVVDAGELAAALLDDLRDMAEADDTASRFFARFVAAAAANDGVDPLDPSATVDSVMLDSITATFLLSGFLRGAMAELVPLQSAVAPRFEVVAARAVPRTGTGTAQAQAAPPGNPCNPTDMLEQIAFWVQWVASKIAGGVQLPGMQAATRSAASLVVRSANAAAAVGQAAAWASGAIGALLFALQMSALTVAIDVPGGLVRTHSAAHHGDPGQATVTLTYDLEGSLLDGGEGIKNCLLVYLNALGIQAALPANGAVPGATIKFDGREGINDYWLFDSASQLEQTTDSNGVVLVNLTGKIQIDQIAPDAPEWDRQATMDIAATPEAVNERSIASTFWDSVVAPFGGIPGAIAPIIDILKTIRYDLGEQGFLVIDWSHGWFIDTTGNGQHSEGIKCYDPAFSPSQSLDGDWVMQGNYTQRSPTGEQKGDELWEVTIGQGGTGHYTYTDTARLVTTLGITVYVTGKAEGDADVTLMSDGTVHMHLVDTKHTYTTTTNLGGHGNDTPGPLRANILVWNPGADCP